MSDPANGNSRSGKDATRAFMGRNAIIQDARSSAYQRSAQDLIDEARQLQDLTAPAASASNTPHALLTSPEEIAFFRQTKREEMENLVQRNFRQLNNWLKYAEWEESQKDYVRARSVYERAIPSHGSKPELWRQYAEMEMRCPAPPLKKAQSEVPISIPNRHQNLSEDVKRLLGAEQKDPHTTSSRPITSTSLILVPSSTSSVSTSIAAPSALISQLEKAVAQGGPNAVIARVRTVFDRALSSLPQCDDLWMKYIVFEATIAESPEDDESVRSLYHRWLRYVPMPHVYELFVEFECNLAHFANPAARRERAESLLKELVAAHSSVRTWLIYADVMENEFSDPHRAVAVLQAALVALGPHAKFNHDGVLMQEIGRLYGQLGVWASEGRQFMQRAFEEAKRIEQAEHEKKQDSNPSAGRVTINNRVSETLFLSYTALEKQFGGHNAAALEQLNLMGQRLLYYSLLERHDNSANIDCDAIGLTLTLRLVGCDRDEDRLRRIDKLLQQLESVGGDLGTQSSYVSKGSLEDHSNQNMVKSSMWTLTSLLTEEKKALAIVTLDDAQNTTPSTASLSSVATGTGTATGLMVTALERFKNFNSSSIAKLCDSAKECYINLVLEVASLRYKMAEDLAKTATGENWRTMRKRVEDTLNEAKDFVRKALDLLPSHSLSLWRAAIGIQWALATTASQAKLPPQGAGDIRAVFGAAIAHLKGNEKELSELYRLYIAFERLVPVWEPGMDLLTVGQSPTFHEAAIDAVRQLYMEALRPNPFSMEWWTAFAQFELSVNQEERCFQIFAKAESQLKGRQASLAQEIAAATSGGVTTTATMRKQWADAAEKLQSELDALFGSRLGLLLRCGRTAGAIELYTGAVRAALEEYSAQAVAAAEEPSSSGLTKKDTISALPPYKRLQALLAALPTFAPQMANTSPVSDGTALGKPRGDDTASVAYTFASGLYRTLATELRRWVTSRMTFSNDSLALEVMEPFLNLWRTYEAQYGTKESLAAVSGDTRDATNAAEGNAGGKAKKRRRLAELAEDY